MHEGYGHCIDIEYGSRDLGLGLGCDGIWERDDSSRSALRASSGGASPRLLGLGLVVFDLDAVLDFHPFNGFESTGLSAQEVLVPPCPAPAEAEAFFGHARESPQIELAGLEQEMVRFVEVSMDSNSTCGGGGGGEGQRARGENLRRSGTLSA